MVLEPVLRPTFSNNDVVKHGQLREGKQRYKCRNDGCSRCIFIREYVYWGYLPEVKQQIADLAVNSSGIRDTARVTQNQSNHRDWNVKKTVISKHSMKHV